MHTLEQIMRVNSVQRSAAADPIRRRLHIADTTSTILENKPQRVVIDLFEHGK
jgi:hypothetical protein